MLAGTASPTAAPRRRDSPDPLARLRRAPNSSLLPPTPFRRLSTASDSSEEEEIASLASIPPEQRAEYLCRAADSDNAHHLNKRIIVTRETADEIELKIYVGVAEKPGAVISAGLTGTAATTAPTPIAITDIKKSLQTTDLSAPESRSAATLKLNKKTGKLTINTAGLNSDQTKESIQTGFHLAIRACALQAKPGQKITLNLETIPADTAAAASALIECLKTDDRNLVGRFNLTETSNRAEAFLRDLAKLSGADAQMRKRIKEILSPEAKQFFEAESAQYPEPKAPTPTLKAPGVATPAASPPARLRSGSDPAPLSRSSLHPFRTSGEDAAGDQNRATAPPTSPAVRVA